MIIIEVPTVADFEALHHGRIGASNMAQIMGLHPGRGKDSAWMSILHHDKIQYDAGAVERMQMGKDIETFIAKRFEQRTGILVELNGVEAGDTYSPHRKVWQFTSGDGWGDRPWLICTPDGWTSDGAGLEIKNASEFNRVRWGLSGTTISRPFPSRIEDPQDFFTCPVEYEIQCRVGMAALDVPAWYLAVLIGGWDFRWYKILRDETFETRILSAADNFYHDHIKPPSPPPTGPLGCSEAILKIIYPESVAGEIVDADPNTMRHVRNMCRAVNDLKDAKRRADDAMLAIKNHMAGAELLRIDGFEKPITWKSSRDGSRPFNKSKFLEEFNGQND